MRTKMSIQLQFFMAVGNLAVFGENWLQQSVQRKLREVFSLFFLISGLGKIREERKHVL